MQAPGVRNVRPALHYAHAGKFLLSLSEVHKHSSRNRRAGITHDLTEQVVENFARKINFPSFKFSSLALGQLDLLPDPASPDSMPDLEIHVTVQTIGIFPEQFILYLDPKESIDNVKQRIWDMKRKPRSGQNLIFGQHSCLNNDRTLKDYNIQHGDTLHLVCRMGIYVKTPRGQTFTVGVMPTDTVGHLKNLIYDMTARTLDPQHQRLTLAGEVLEDAFQLIDYEVGPWASIELDKFVHGKGGQSDRPVCGVGSCLVCRFWEDWESGV